MTRAQEFENFLNAVWDYIEEGRSDLFFEGYGLWPWQFRKKAAIRKQRVEYRVLEAAVTARDERRLRELMPGSPVWERMDA